ncbi:triacylglycerol hydrolase DDHD2-like [Babylonia areolata]|uniref:triacylglycerol hydrolase DDHD2-like n=1 Tax=Babylonia areolata TaxID=304850 RepID=UPI003FD3E72F
MAEKNQKEPTPPPLLLMSTGGLTLDADQPSLMPVMQTKSSSVLDEDGEADNFVGQDPPAGGKTASTVDSPPTQGHAGGGGGPTTVGSMGNYFQSGSTGASDPFAHVAYLPPPQPLPASFTLTQTTTAPSSLPSGTSSSPYPSTSHLSMSGQTTQDQGQGHIPSTSTSSLSAVDGSQPAAWVPPSAEKAPPNIYRQKGPMRYAQPPPDAYGLNTAFSSVSHPNMAAPSSMGLPPPPPPSGFSPAPFMTHAPGSSGPPFQGMSYFPGSSSQPSLSSAQPRGVSVDYQVVQHHWCYRKVVEGHEIWYTFSRLDSGRLEEQYLKEVNGGASEVVSTDGGRYDVEIKPRLRRAVYWDEEPFTIQRCSWFYKRERDSRYVPFDEMTANILEDEYKKAIMNNDWHKRIELPDRDSVVMHNPSVIVHFLPASQPDEWGNVQTDQRPRVVKRGIEDFGTVEDGEPAEVDHLVFVLHGIGETCHMQFRNIVDCVDDFRSISNSLIKSHFGPYTQSGHVHRVEFLPVYWNMALHSDTSSVDSRMKAITLPSTRKLRDFFNNTMIDILFYTSPAYCQIICDTVCQEMNRLFQMFLTRNPSFSGEVSLAGHSLGGSILFDLLMHQREVGDAVNAGGLSNASNARSSRNSSPVVKGTPERDTRGKSEEKAAEPELTLEGVLEKVGLKNKMSVFEEEQIDLDALLMCTEQDLKDLHLPMGPRRKLQQLIQDENGKREKKLRQELREEIRKEFEGQLQDDSKKPASSSSTGAQDSTQLHPSISVDYICGLSGTGQPAVHYRQLEFSPSCLFTLGSPVAVFLTVRGVQSIGENFKLPTCSRFLNVFHPFDPVAYRVEPLISCSSSALKPVLVPHHKGRKRLHLELKESIQRMGSDLKQKIIESLRSTWNTLHEFALAHRRDAGRVADDGEDGLEREVDHQVNSVMAHLSQHQHSDDKSDTASVCSSHDEDIPMGQLNEGRRVDYVLQEAPIESFNDYLFALASHSCYWNSEDTVLLILKEIYSPLGISPLMPGPDGRPPRLFMPPAVSNPPPPRTLTSYVGTGQPMSVPLQVTTTSSQGPSAAPPPSILPPGPLPQHVQGPLARTASPFMAGGSESQGSSRSSTPPVGGLAAAASQGVRGNPGPPPMSGFVRPQPL